MSHSVALESVNTQVQMRSIINKQQWIFLLHFFAYIQYICRTELYIFVVYFPNHVELYTGHHILLCSEVGFNNCSDNRVAITNNWKIDLIVSPITSNQ